MTRRHERPDRAAAFRMVRRGAGNAYTFGGSHLEIGNDASEALTKGSEGEIGNRGVAAHAGCVLRGLQLFAMELRQPIYELAQPLGSRMLLLVPFLPLRRVAEPKVGRGIDDASAERGPTLDLLRAVAVTLGQE